MGSAVAAPTPVAEPVIAAERDQDDADHHEHDRRQHGVP